MIKRCAVYTRKSTEEGLDQAFNSLDAQRDACEAYIASQKGEGWKLVKTRFDDGGISGGTMERPALKALLSEIESGNVDIVVVYKVDRLTRSLADFAKLVERFDANGVSFVSVTQAFNTSNSMGRLTLNVLLSFAQFEREVTAERIKDKIAASRRKGLWTGGSIPLGYDAIDKKLVVNEEEAQAVRRLFELYREAGSARCVLEVAIREGIRTKRRSNGSGGNVMSRGPLYHLLSNPIYAGLVRSGKDLYPGEHRAIIDKDVWEEVQQRLKQRAGGARSSPPDCQNALAGKLFAMGERLTQSRSNTRGRRYRYYVSHILETGREASDKRWRLVADAVDSVITTQIMEWATSPTALQDALKDGVAAQDLIVLRKTVAMHYGEFARSPLHDRVTLMAAWIDRVDISETSLQITLRSEAMFGALGPQHVKERIIIDAPVRFSRRRQGLRIILGAVSTPASPDKTALRLLARARRWCETWFQHPDRTLADIAAADGVSFYDASKEIRLAFLAPDIIEAMLDGGAEHIIAERLRRLRHLPPRWSDQMALMGFAP